MHKSVSLALRLTTQNQDIIHDSIDIRTRIGYLPQDNYFYEHMTAHQTLEYTARFFFAGPQNKMITDKLTQHAIQDRMNLAHAERVDQYTLWQILGIWAFVALPMALLSWVVAPALIPFSPLPPGITYWLLTITGMAWQFVVSLVILYREVGTLRWSAIRQRTWLQTPRDPGTDRPNSRLFWWILPAGIFGLYHLHKPWTILSNIMIDLGATWPARRFRSSWMAIVVHGTEGIFALGMILAVILGLAPGQGGKP